MLISKPWDHVYVSLATCISMKSLLFCVWYQFSVCHQQFIQVSRVSCYFIRMNNCKLPKLIKYIKPGLLWYCLYVVLMMHEISSYSHMLLILFVILLRWSLWSMSVSLNLFWTSGFLKGLSHYPSNVSISRNWRDWTFMCNRLTSLNFLSLCNINIGSYRSLTESNVDVPFQT